jgi:hypothetical protein
MVKVGNRAYVKRPMRYGRVRNCLKSCHGALDRYRPSLVCVCFPHQIKIVVAHAPTADEELLTFELTMCLLSFYHVQVAFGFQPLVDVYDLLAGVGSLKPVLQVVTTTEIKSFALEEAFKLPEVHIAPDSGLFVLWELCFRVSISGHFHLLIQP